MKNCLLNIDDAGKLINAGSKLLVAGSESALDRLPQGAWMGGTIPYFMSEDGGLKSNEHVFVTEMPNEVTNVSFATYTVSDISQIAADSPVHGISFLILPAFSEVVSYYAKNAPEFPEMFLRPIMGWISGVQLEDTGKVTPKVYIGLTGEKFEDRGVAMHATLEPNVSAKIDIVNIFEPGNGPILTFPETTFCVKNCLVDGVPTSLAKYIFDHKIDSRLPLVTDLCGAIINSSISSVDAVKDEVVFFAPVFPGHDYRFAEPVKDYAATFEQLVPKNAEMFFSCNCILNYVYGDFEGKKLAGAPGPMTFGEIAYQLLNQTMVFVELERS